MSDEFYSAATIQALYTPVSFRRVFAEPAKAAHRRVLAVWAASILVCIVSGLAAIKYNWSGIPVTLAGVQVHLTFYFPMVICTLLTLWLGFWWGLLPAFLAAFLLALYSGLPLGWSLLFGFSDLPGLFLLVLAYRAVPMRLDLRPVGAFLFYAFIILIGYMATSGGALIWTTYNDVGVHDTFEIWQGWWMGGFLSTFFPTAIVLYCANQRMASWKRRVGLGETWGLPRPALVARTLIFLMVFVVGYLWTADFLGMANLNDSVGKVLNYELAAEVVSGVQALRLVHTVELAVALFFGIFGFLIATRWTESLRSSLSERVQELSASEERFRLLAKASPAIVFQTDVAGKSIYVNDERWQAVTGRAPGSWAGDGWAEAVHPDDQQATFGSWERAVARGEAWRHEFRFRHVDGADIWVLGLAFPIKDENDAIAGFVGTCNDITDLKRSEVALRRSHDLLAQAQALANFGSFEWEVSQNRLTWSDELFRIYGYEPGGTAPTLETFLGHIHEADRARVQEAIEQAMATGDSWQLEERIVRPDGSVRILATRGQVNKGPDGEVDTLVGVCRDITEQKRTEEAVRAREVRFRNIFESSAVSLWEEDFSAVKAALDKLKRRRVKDFDSYFRKHPEFVREATRMLRLVNVNTAALEMYDAGTKEELIGSLDRIFTEDSLDVFRQELVAIAEGHKRFEAEAVNQTLRGRNLEVLLSMRIPSEREAFSRVIVSIQDISELKKTQRALQASRADLEQKNAALEALNQMARAAYSSLDIKTIAGKSTEAMLQYSNSPVVAFGTIDAKNGVFKLIHSRGFRRDVVAKASDLPLEGSLTGLAVAQKKVVVSEDLLKDERVVEGLKEMFKRDGLMSAASVPLLFRNQALGAMNLLFTKERRFSEHEVATLAGLGRTIGLAVANARHVAQIQAEVAERKRAQEKLRHAHAQLEKKVMERTAQLARAKERAEAADRAKSAFLANMSHELRTPLNSIIGFSGIMLRELAGPLLAEQKKQLGMVRDSARHLLNLINDVLDISKIEADQLSVSLEPFDFCKIVNKVIETQMPSAREKGIALTAEIGPEVGPLVSDPRRVEQILINLVNNAVKFTRRGSVCVACTVEGAQLVTRVSDTGPGIEEKDMGGLFRPFEQVGSGLAREHEGTGLGLSISKRLVELLGGEISVESEWRRGSTFIFTLPCENEGAGKS